MHAYAGPACICRMHAPSMLIPPSQRPSITLIACDSLNRTTFTFIDRGSRNVRFPPHFRT